jgi:hypothetical protein
MPGQATNRAEPTASPDRVAISVSRDPQPAEQPRQVNGLVRSLSPAPSILSELTVFSLPFFLYSLRWIFLNRMKACRNPFTVDAW